MTSTKKHPNWKRPKGLEWDIQEGDKGWEAIVKWEEDGEVQIQTLRIRFATEELAINAARAIVDYAYGPAEIDLSKVKVKPKEADEKKPTRKAPKRKNVDSARSDQYNDVHATSNSDGSPIEEASTSPLAS